ncbi:MAG: hypothetical protein ABR552_05555 [Actinomycetota bacterium]
MESATTIREDAPLAIPIGQMSVLEDLVRQVEEMVRTARNMPLSSSALIDRQAVLDIVDVLKRSIPEEIARARAVIRDRDELLERAQAQAEKVLERARDQRKQLLSQTEIVSAATRQAEQLIGEAEAVAERIKVEAERYAEGKLATFEVALRRTLGAVERGRARLAGHQDADELVSDPD